MPEINLTAGELPPPACYASEQDRLEAYAAAMIAQFNASPEWAANSVAPANLSLYWLRLDAGGNPVEVLKYNTTPPAGWTRATTQFTYGVGGGVANAYTLTLLPASPGANQAYRTGVSYAFVPTALNTGASTLDVDGKGPKAITKYGAVALAAGDIVPGQMAVVIYDGTQFQLLTPNMVPPGYIVPGVDRQFLRTSGSPGVTLWESGYLTQSAGYQAIPAAGGTVTFTHGFSVTPIFWDIGIICTDAGGDAGYALNDYIPHSSLGYNTGEHGIYFTAYANLTSIGLIRGNLGLGIAVFDKATGNQIAITEAKWRVMARAIR